MVDPERRIEVDSRSLDIRRKNLKRNEKGEQRRKSWIFGVRDDTEKKFSVIQCHVFCSEFFLVKKKNEGTKRLLGKN